ncbi:hypothetical protein Oter_1338 [Opitutus terrae PB90-1]|uniref:Uncharacterized protein n=2 Tax=Opitutus terrae TaxID=107709 RepID=B1ZRD6_OPITP|nr:hypothetical protein Oter_1338 [Opitutus terrae PB90-1]
MHDPSPESGWRGFWLLPKSFQQNPELEMTVFSEVTDLGRSLPTATPEEPVYYVGHNGGFTERGDHMGERPPAANYLGQVLRHALTTNGYQPATAQHPASLLLIFHWGSHHAMDREMRVMFPELSRRHFLERAKLVGGRRFESSVSRRISFGDFLTDHTADVEFLADQANLGVYFAVVSAYDLASHRQGRRQLVWRTSLTVNTSGVSMVDTLPALILTAAPSFGRDMRAPDVVCRRVRRGVVEYGPPVVVESDVSLATPSLD